MHIIVFIALTLLVLYVGLSIVLAAARKTPRE